MKCDESFVFFLKYNFQYYKKIFQNDILSKKFTWYCWESQIHYMGTQNQTNSFDRTETLKGYLLIRSFV